MEAMMQEKLLKAALEAREQSYSPLSHFAVGAALLAENGEIFQGCNVEVSGYSSTLCAERTALFHAVSTGKRAFLAVCIVGGAQGQEITSFCPPCGVCRQALLEFAKDPETFEILLWDGKNTQIHTLAQLLPLGFKET
jgi:cytidine deaminase